ncbi:MAG: hypothetical protein E3J60_04460 [Dehalococcoidia bacterium]|nr:MAG: hypothetical protein E3J60_04460 [Dehalococcoidia bacterium]
MNLDIIYNKSSQRITELPDESIDMCLTSPPYYGLRDYGEDVKEIWGGDKDCKHEFENYVRPAGGGHPNPDKAQVGTTKKDVQRIYGARAAFCQKCGAWYGQLGLEPTFQLYLDHMMIVCAEIKRVLKKTGSFWLNMGDTYGGSWGDSYSSGRGKPNSQREQTFPSWYRKAQPRERPPQSSQKIRAKCLIGIPWRLVLHLIDEQGWVLRNVIIWHKPNAMPSSVKDRCSNSYEHLFHLVKGKEKYKWPKNIKLITKEDRIWLAAIVDGEGTIGIMKSKRENWVDSFAPYVRVCNSTKAIVDKCVEITGLGAVRIHKDKVAKERGYRQIYEWQPSDRSAAYIIGQIYDYLIGKKEQAKIAIALEERLPPRGIKGKHTSETEYKKREELWILSKQLNQHNIKNSGLPNINAKWKGPIYGNCEKYIYDLDAIREEHREGSHSRGGKKFRGTVLESGQAAKKGGWNEYPATINPAGKNPGDVWAISTQPRPEAHFATFPDKLCIKPILATCPAEICRKCGKTRVRITKTNLIVDKEYINTGKVKEVKEAGDRRNVLPRSRTGLEGHNEYQTIGWTDCGCNAGWDSGVLFDPFAGRGTSLIMAKKLGRHYVGYELKREYADMAERELENIDPLFRRK